MTVPPDSRAMLPSARDVAPSDLARTTVLVKGAAPYRYLRYRGPDGGCRNVAEIEFRGATR